ncbi:MAG: hypothetical protein QOK89_00405 [Nitrososphaeraceae archaeon]|jgi:hypothetical protein|nr:hypothetical protein [Nitrososphaeraceae archaeon]
MAYVSDDPNFTEKRYNTVYRKGDITGESADNVTTDLKKAAKLATLLEGISFPTNKERIKDHLNRLSPSMGNRINDVLEAIQNNLDDNVEYNSTYEIEKSAGLVEQQ